MNADALKGHLDPLILSVLSVGPLHGYAVIQRLRDISDGVFDLPEGTIYPALHRLERAGLLSSAWDTGAGRRRRVYAVTDRGAGVLGERRSDWQAFSRAVDTILLEGACTAQM
jgi:PadR family transcriptional regulator, regulatory protein PadR